MGDMHGGGGQPENEIKLRIASADQARATLERLGYRIVKPRVFEANSVFDTGDLRLRQQRSLLRLREAGGRSTLTFKGPPQPGRHKTREEIETRLESAPAARAILERLGLECCFRYEKYRTEYQRDPEPGLVTLDETPVGVLLELEGPAEWVDQTAERLGYSERDYITDSYFTLYVDYCSQKGLVRKDMVFGPS